MSSEIYNYLVTTLDNPKRMNGQFFLTAMFLVKKWRNGATSGADAELAPLLEAEVVDDEAMEYLRERLVAFASATNSTQDLVAVIGVLSLFRDSRHVPLFQTWLLRETQQLVAHRSTMYQLIIALNDCGKGTISRAGYGTSEIKENLADARAYLLSSLGVRVPG